MRRAATDLCCDRLADEAAILACAMYADLNPIRARLADTPETSEFASAYDRIKARRAEMLEREDREAPILERLEIRPERFVDAAGRFGELFHRGAGREDRVARLRERAGRRRFPGRRQCQAVFSSA